MIAITLNAVDISFITLSESEIIIPAPCLAYQGENSEGKEIKPSLDIIKNYQDLISLGDETCIHISMEDNGELSWLIVVGEICE